MKWGNESVPKVVLTALTIAVVATMMMSVGTSSAAFSVYNYGWDGTSSLRSMEAENGVEVGVIYRTSSYRTTEPRETITLAISPDTEYRNSELIRVKRFVENGGTFVVAGRSANQINGLLRKLGASTRLDGRLLVDTRFYSNSPVMPRATNVSDDSLSENIDEITLNYGTVVRPNGADVLVRTSEYAYLDTNRNKRVDPSENVTSYPIVVREQIGHGRIIVVSDASIFINAMLSKTDNKRFVRDLLLDHNVLLFDYSHVEGIPPMVFALLEVRRTSLLQFAISTVTITAIAIWAWYPRLLASIFPVREWRNSHFDGNYSDEEMVRHLKQRYPSWDQEHVERIVDAVERRRRG